MDKDYEEVLKFKKILSKDYFLEDIVHAHLKDKWLHIYIRDEISVDWRLIRSYASVHSSIMEFISKNEEFKSLLLNIHGYTGRPLIEGADLIYKTN